MCFSCTLVFYEATALRAVAGLQSLVSAGSHSVWYAQPEVHLSLHEMRFSHWLRLAHKLELRRRSESDAEHFRTRKKKEYLRLLDSVFLFYGVVVWFDSLTVFFFIL